MTTPLSLNRRLVAAGPVRAIAEDKPLRLAGITNAAVTRDGAKGPYHLTGTVDGAPVRVELTRTEDARGVHFEGEVFLNGARVRALGLIDVDELGQTLAETGRGTEVRALAFELLQAAGF